MCKYNEDATCKTFDMKRRFGKKYKIFMDEAWEVEDSQSNSDKVKDKPWYYEIHGKYGAIYLYGKDKLAVRITANRIKSRIKAEYKDILSLYLEAEDESIFLFNLDNFEIVAKLIKARRKKQLSDQERVRLRNISGLVHYKKQNTAQILA
jgi:hypothetical protein